MSGEANLVLQQFRFMAGLPASGAQSLRLNFLPLAICDPSP